MVSSLAGIDLPFTPNPPAGRCASHRRSSFGQCLDRSGDPFDRSVGRGSQRVRHSEGRALLGAEVRRRLPDLPGTREAVGLDQVLLPQPERIQIIEQRLRVFPGIEIQIARRRHRRYLPVDLFIERFVFPKTPDDAVGFLIFSIDDRFKDALVRQNPTIIQDVFIPELRGGFRLCQGSNLDLFAMQKQNEIADDTTQRFLTAKTPRGRVRNRPMMGFPGGSSGHGHEHQDGRNKENEDVTDHEALHII